MRTPCLLLLALAGCAHAADAAPAAKPDTSSLFARITGVQFTQSVQFTRQSPTVPVGGEHAGTISVQVGSVDDAVPVLSVVRTTFTVVETDAGENLALPIDPTVQDSSPRHGMLNRAHYPKDMLKRLSKEQVADVLALHGSAKIRMPTKPAKALARLEGVVVVTIEAKPTEPIVLSPLSDWIGKPKEIPGASGPFTVEKLDGGELTYSMPADLFPRIKEVQLVDAAGAEVPQRGTSTGGDGKRYTSRVHVTMSADGTLRLVLLGETAEIELPLKADGLSVEPPPPKPAIQRKPKAPAAPAEAPPKPASEF